MRIFEEQSKRCAVLQVDDHEISGYSMEANQNPAPQDATYNCSKAAILVWARCNLCPSCISEDEI